MEEKNFDPVIKQVNQATSEEALKAAAKKWHEVDTVRFLIRPDGYAIRNKICLNDKWSRVKTISLLI